MWDARQDNVSIIETALHTDTFLHQIIDPWLSIRCLSVRCRESQIEQLPNQDFLRLVIAHRIDTLYFCVCDGVGSSYLGHFAARHLARRLVTWLQTLPQIPDDPVILLPSLEASFATWSEQAEEKLYRIPLPLNISLWERSIIEEQRDLYGSESVFLAGRIEYTPVVNAPEYIRALFCWMGNITGHSFIGHNQYKELGDQGDDQNRWSTKRGSRGAITVQTSTLYRGDPLVIHTDGLNSIGHDLASLDDTAIQDRAQALLQQPTNDDMTMLEFRWGICG